jgi:prenyltransferase beta subunit
MKSRDFRESKPITDLHISLKKGFYFLSKSQNCDGGWGYAKGNSSSTEPTSFAIIALSPFKKSEQHILCGLNWMSSNQNQDGGWGNLPRLKSDISTAFAIMALNASARRRDYEGQIRKATRWLRTHTGPNGGWSWRMESWGFPEPTALGLLTLSVIKAKKSSKQYIRAIELLKRQQCQDGGWNAGSAVMLGVSQSSKLHPTAIVTLSLLSLGHDPGVAQLARDGLRRIGRMVSSEKTLTPYSLSLVILAIARKRQMLPLVSNLVKKLCLMQEKDGSWCKSPFWSSLATISLTRYAGGHIV